MYVYQLVLLHHRGTEDDRGSHMGWWWLCMQVAMHNTPDDCWVSFLGMVYNITELIKVRVAHVQADLPHRCSCQNA